MRLCVILCKIFPPAFLFDFQPFSLLLTDSSSLVSLTKPVISFCLLLNARVILQRKAFSEPMAIRRTGVLKSEPVRRVSLSVDTEPLKALSPKDRLAYLISSSTVTTSQEEGGESEESDSESYQRGDGFLHQEPPSPRRDGDAPDNLSPRERLGHMLRTMSSEQERPREQREDTHKRRSAQDLFHDVVFKAERDAMASGAAARERLQLLCDSLNNSTASRFVAETHDSARQRSFQNKSEPHLVGRISNLHESEVTGGEGSSGQKKPMGRGFPASWLRDPDASPFEV